MSSLTHLVSFFPSAFCIPAFSSSLSPTIIQQFTCPARILSTCRLIFFARVKATFLLRQFKNSRHGTVAQNFWRENSQSFFYFPFFSEYSTFILGTFILTLNHHFTGPRNFPIKTTYNLEACTFSRRWIRK